MADFPQLSASLPTSETVAIALERLAAAIREGHVLAFSIYSEESGVTRLSVIYTPTRTSAK